MGDIKIYQNVGTISSNDTGWQKELNKRSMIQNCLIS